MSAFNAFSKWLLNHKIITTLAMFFIIALAVFSALNISKSILPNVDIKTISISSAYPSASTKTIERTLCQPLENAIRDIDNVFSVTTHISNKLCNVSIQLDDHSQLDDTLERIRSNIDGLQNLPAQATKPNIISPKISVPLIRILISGTGSIDNMINLTPVVIQELNAIGISDIKEEGINSSKTHIEVPSEQLKKHGLSLAEIAAVIEKNLGNISSGKISTNSESIAIETLGNIQNVSDLENIILRSYPNGFQLKLSDIATLDHNIDLSEHKFYHNRQPAVSLIVSQGNLKNLADTSNIVNQYITTKNKQLPDSLELVLIKDTSSVFNARMNMLGKNALYGLLLVFIVLSIFLNFRLALWVTVGIPIAFSGGLIALYLSGDSLNMISTFAFLLVLGIIVDDAIVVSESIYSAQEQHGNTPDSVLSGLNTVAKPVLFAVSTSIIMFTPLWFIPGIEGKLFSAIPLIAIAALFFSLIECFFILPAHLNLTSKTTSSGLIHSFQSGLYNATMPLFESVLRFSIKWRYSVIAFFSIIFLLCASLLMGGWINARFISTIETDEVLVRVDLPDGTPKSTLKEYVHTIETAAQSVKQELKQTYQFKSSPPVVTVLEIFGPNTASVIMSFPNEKNRSISSQHIADLWRKKTGPLEQASHLEFTATFNKPGPSIKLRLQSDDSTALLKATNHLTQFMRQQPTVYGVENTLRRGAKEVSISLKESARQYQVSSRDVALLVNQAFHGIYIGESANYPSDIIIRLPNNERNTVWHLEHLHIPTVTGNLVTLGDIADLHFKTGDTTIIRNDYKRSLDVSAYVDESKNSTEDVFEHIRQHFLDDLSVNYPGVSWKKSGALKVKESSRNSFLLGSLLALISMYALLVFLYRSFIKPFIVLSAVPFGFVGAILGHWLFNLDVTIWSFSGMAAVSGIVINDNIVLVSAIHDAIKERTSSVKDAIVSASKMRFRPILLTSITTIVGVTPIIFETSIEAQFLIPMAVSIAFGELLATIVSLFLVPIIYMVYEEANGVFTGRGRS